MSSFCLVYLRKRLNEKGIATIDTLAKKYNAHTTPDFFVSLFMDEDTASIIEREAIDYRYIAKM